MDIISSKIFVTDSEGKNLEITNLNQAIAQAENMVALTINQKDLNDFQKNREAYWKDLLQKLKKIKG